MLSQFLAALLILISNLAVAVERGPALPDYPAKQVAPHTYAHLVLLGYCQVYTALKELQFEPWCGHQ